MSRQQIETAEADYIEFIKGETNGSLQSNQRGAAVAVKDGHSEGSSGQRGGVVQVSRDRRRLQRDFSAAGGAQPMHYSALRSEDVC